MKTTKKIWGALALSTMLAGTTVSVLAQPDLAAPKGDNPPNVNRPPRDKDKGNKGNRPDKRGGQNKPNPLMAVSAEDLKKALGDNLSDAQKAQLTGAVQERDLAIKAAEDRFKAQLLQASGLNEQQLRQKVREEMKKMRDQRDDRPNGKHLPPDIKPLPPEPAPAPPADAMPDNDG